MTISLSQAADQQDCGCRVLRVLILEDRAEDAELILRELRRGGFDPRWERVDNECEYLESLSTRPDVILADYRMPQFDAARALELLRQSGMEIPFLVVSGTIGEDLAVAMMKAGASDYVLKDRLARLGPAVRRALDEKQQREEARAAEAALRSSEVRFHSFMNNSPALAFIKDVDGRILYANGTCEQVWSGGCQGKHDSQLWPPEAARQLREHDLAVIASGEASRVVEELSLGDGRPVDYLSIRFPFVDAQGERLLGAIFVDISEQVRSEKALAAAVATKEVLLRELHHRVKNNLQVISSLLSMQAETLRNSDLSAALAESQRRVECMALIHDRLNPGQEDWLDFREYVETLAANLVSSHGASGRVELRFVMEPTELELDQAIPCGLILNELITNALKYAFPGGRGGEIRIGLDCDAEGFVRLAVADDGVGMPAGLDWRESESLGLRIVSILARQLGGSVGHEDAGGVEFSVRFKKRP